MSGLANLAFFLVPLLFSLQPLGVLSGLVPLSALAPAATGMRTAAPPAALLDPAETTASGVSISGVAATETASSVVFVVLTRPGPQASRALNATSGFIRAVLRAPHGGLDPAADLMLVLQAPVQFQLLRTPVLVLARSCQSRVHSLEPPPKITSAAAHCLLGLLPLRLVLAGWHS